MPISMSSIQIVPRGKLSNIPPSIWRCYAQQMGLPRGISGNFITLHAQKIKWKLTQIPD
jgi:hypothetical protein